MDLRRVLASDQIRLLDAYWRAATYLTVGQPICWRTRYCVASAPGACQAAAAGSLGTTPGLNPLYAHLNQVIGHELNAMYVISGPGPVANACLVGTCGEVYPQITGDGEGLRRRFWQFSLSGGFLSHVARRHRVDP